MIAFATMLLGLVAGEVRIDLLVAGPVAAVELRLDGALCDRREAPPWSAACDLGDEISPHRLTAVAFDRGGAELARAEQWLNVDRPDAEISLVIDEAGGRRLLRIATASAEAERPRELVVSVDGVEIAAGDPAAVVLPRLDLATPHLVRVEAIWSDRVRAAADAVLGGDFGARLATELTAVPISVEGRRTPRAADLAGTIRRDGAPLRIAAVERGLGELWVIAAPDRLAEPARHVASGSLPTTLTGRMTTLRDPRTRAALGGLDWRFVGRLATDDRLRIVWPWPERRDSGGRAHELFLPSPPFAARTGGVPWLLYHARLPPAGDGPPPLADAVAVAGMTLAGSERRRAVLVLLDDTPSDDGRLTPARARRYLERLRVPLHVWRFGGGSTAAPDPWGEVRWIGSSRQLTLALRDLARDLDRQRIAWVEGAHLPTEIELAGVDPAAAPWTGASAADEVAADAEAALAASEARALAEEVARRTAARRALVDDAVGTDARRATAAGLELLLARRVPLATEALERAVVATTALWARATGVTTPSLEGARLAIVERLADHPELVGATTGLGARGHAAFGVAVLEGAGRAGDEIVALAAHELAHLVGERAFLAPLPVWLEEGIAEHLARRDLAAADPGAALMRRGEIVRTVEAGGVRTAAHGPLADLLDLARAHERGALPALASWTALSWRDFVAPADRARRYALAGELCGFLFEADAARAARLRAVLARATIDAELDVGAALATALGDANPLDDAFRSWLLAERDRAVAAAGATGANDANGAWD